MNFALLSDTHISGPSDLVAFGQSPAPNLESAVRQILEFDPEFVLLNGDCAFRIGLPESYAKIDRLLAPLKEAGIPCHLLAGNHDNPDAMAQEIRDLRVVEAGPAVLLLLNTQIAPTVVPGRIGQSQLDRLHKTLAHYEDRPVMIFGHHNPAQPERTDCDHGIGLLDSERWMQFLEDHPQVRAYVFGHTHSWHVSESSTGWLVNLPACGFSFYENRPTGWVAGKLDERGCELELRAFDPQHPQAGDKARIPWSPDPA